MPDALSIWFIIHFALDILFAIPLLVAPVLLLETLGWTSVDPVTARLVGAALVGIGVESWFGRNADVQSFRTMLRLKLLWSAAATVGLVVSAVEGAPPMVWAFVVIFAGFFGVWAYWFVRLN